MIRGGSILIENPADRANPAEPILYDKAFSRHGPLWLMPAVQAFKKKSGAKLTTFAQCRFGGDFQKYTSLLVTPSLFKPLQSLDRMMCNHADGTHSRQANGRLQNGKWISADASAWPAELNEKLASAVATRHTQRTTATTSGGHKRSCDDEKTQDVETSKLHNTSDDDEKNSMTPQPASPRSDPLADYDTEFPMLPDMGNTTSRILQELYTDHPGANFPGGTGIPLGERRQGSRAGSEYRYPPATQNSGEDMVLIIRSTGGHILTINDTENSTAPTDPRNRKEAMQQDPEGWSEAEAAELRNHVKNGSFVIMSRKDLPSGRKLIRFTWAYKIKRTGKKTARLCVQGCNMTPGVDFDQTFSATLRAASLRVMAALAAYHSLLIQRVDFVAAYLQGLLEENEVIYCSPPPGYNDNDNMYKLVKPVYGMAQSGRRWQRCIFPWLTEWGFSQCTSDPYLFSILDENTKLILGCYVDDLCIHTTQTRMCNLPTFHQRLTKDLGCRR